jgi:glutamine---fructose-6-phosphate transaminase (isomerizing)
LSWLESELHEQPEALARLLERQNDAAGDVAAVLAREDVLYVLIASRGTSSNAARYAQYLLGRAHRVPVMFATPSLYTIYEQPPRLDGAAVVGISQSGESPDVVAVLAEARRQGRPTVALTNTAGSPLAEQADIVLLLEAGDERAVAATKTYVNSLGAIALVFSAADGDRSRAELERMPDLLASQIELSLGTPPRLDEYAGEAGATVVARGVNYGSAHEIALKIRELAGLVVEPYSPADLMHGPIAAIGAGWPVVAVAPTGPAFAEMRTVIDAVAARGASIVGITDDPVVSAAADVSLPLNPGVPEWLSPLVAVVPGQLAAMRLAQLRGVDLDNPLGLSKVTLTR